jgi:hypothetical protein
MRRSRPHDCLTVAARDQEETFANCRCAIVTGAQLTPLNCVAHASELPNERLEGLASSYRARPVGLAQHRAPRLEFLDVLEHDDTRAYSSCPARRYPGQTADLLLDGLPTFRF